MDTDVLVVGAGPTGLMLANQLVHNGVRPTIVDRHAGPARETRALGVQARTLEIYARLGVIERALALGKRGTGANLWAEGRRTARIPLADAGRGLSPYPFILILGQDDNERILGDRLHENGVSVQWNTELVAMQQSAGQVIATLKQPDRSTRALAAGWVAGCDGAHSAVRTMCGIAFEGAPYEHVFYVADTVATGNIVPDEVNVYLWKSGFHLFFPMRGDDHWRIVGIVPEALRDRRDLAFEAVVPSLESEGGTSLAFRSCSWFSTYRIHHRSAGRFREGRAFLLGDAAHIHSPVGAQGMNTGLQDAYNLGWKLARVVSGRAGEKLLDSYAAERVPVARRLLATTDRAFRIVVSDSVAAGLLRTNVLARLAAFAMRLPAVQAFAFRTVSQIGIRYRDSPLSIELPGMPGRAPHAGDRFPWLRVRFSDDGRDGGIEDLFARLDDTRFNLVVVGQPLPAIAAHETIRSHVVAAGTDNAAELARASIPSPSFWLLRPDGHVALCGTAVDVAAIASWFDEAMGPATT